MLPINIAFGVDQNYLQQAKVVIASITASSSQAEALRFFVLHAADDGTISREVNAWGNAAVRPVPVSNPFAGSTGRLSAATALRILLPEVLPDLDRVVYLDADIVVRHDIAELFSIDLNGNAIGGAIDTGLYIVMARRMARGDNEINDYLLSHGFDPKRRHYVNAGVLLMDLAKLREMHFSATAFDLASNHPDRFHWFDQCIINKVLMSHIALIDPRWNALANAVQMRRRHRFASADVQEMVAVQARDPWVIHYAGGKKPWETMAAWRAETWWQYADATWPRPTEGGLRAIWRRFSRSLQGSRHPQVARN